MTPQKRRGRPPVFVNDTDGKPITGLSHHKALNQYYATYSKPRVYFGSDYVDAISAYQIWVIQQQKEEPTTPITLKDADEGIKLKRKYTGTKTPITLTQQPFKPGKNLTYKQEGGFKVTKEEVEIPESMQVMIAKKLFATKSYNELADLLKRPELRNIKKGDITHVDPMPINDVIELYKTRDIGIKEMREVKTAWRDFVKVSKVKYVEDIEEKHIFMFRDWVKQQQAKHGYKNDYTYKKYNRVKTVFSKTIPLTDRNTDSLRRALESCQKLINPKRNQTQNAQPISKEIFWKIYNNVDPKWKALLLVCLNCAYYAKDILDLKKELITKINGLDVIDFRRVKKDTKRINVLWKETVGDINKYLEEESHNSEFLFINRYGKVLTPSNIQDNFARFRARLNIPDDVKFNNIRDGAATALFGEVSEDLLNLVIGHQVKGEKKKYIGAKPDLMKQCADIIHKYYFPKE